MESVVVWDIFANIIINISGLARAPQAATAGGPRGWRARQGTAEEVVTVTPWPGSQTICLRGGGENRRYAKGQYAPFGFHVDRNNLELRELKPETSHTSTI